MQAPSRRASSPRPRELNRRSSRREKKTIDTLQTLLSEPSPKQPGLVKQTSSNRLQPQQLTQRKSSRSRDELQVSRSRDELPIARSHEPPLSKPRDDTSTRESVEVRRVTFIDTGVDSIGDSSDEEVEMSPRGRSKDRARGKRSSTPFFRRRSSSLEDDASSPTPLVRKSSKGTSGLARRRSARSQTESPRERRVNFVEEYVPGDSSDDEIVESRGRARERGPGKRSSTPFVRRRISSLSMDDGSEGDGDGGGVVTCDRCGTIVVLSCASVEGVDVEPGN